jgi:3-methyladenine DNA glycosylase AlkD
LKNSELIALLRVELKRAGDPARAAAMQAYMKSAMPYYGVPAVPLRAICKRVFDRFGDRFSDDFQPIPKRPPPIPNAAAWQAQCLSIWRGAKFREEWYAAIGLTGHRLFRSFQTMETLPMYEEMIVTGAWWDVVDSIASSRLGGLLRSYPQPMRKKMLQWSRSKNMWKRRSSILCQLSFKAETDLDLLYACIEPSLESPEFFLRKAIGWALRQYAWTNPGEVRRYVRAHESELSGLSRREALKNISA